MSFSYTWHSCQDHRTKWCTQQVAYLCSIAELLKLLSPSGSCHSKIQLSQAPVAHHAGLGLNTLKENAQRVVVLLLLADQGDNLYITNILWLEAYYEDITMVVEI